MQSSRISHHSRKIIKKITKELNLLSSIAQAPDLDSNFILRNYLKRLRRSILVDFLNASHPLTPATNSSSLLQNVPTLNDKTLTSNWKNSADTLSTISFLTNQTLTYPPLNFHFYQAGSPIQSMANTVLLESRRNFSDYFALQVLRF